MQKDELIIDALDWKVVYDHELHEYLLIDKNIDECYCLDCIAKLTYDINTTPTDEFDTLFDNDCCGERVCEDHIEFLWFKERPCTLHIIGD